jgi:cytochrome o ubiquinol oxidase subunit 2
MSIKLKGAIIALILVEVVLLGLLFLGGANFQILNPQGPIALRERNLIFMAMGTMFAVAIPMLVTLYFFVYKYRADNKKATYEPDRNRSKTTLFFWWFIPLLVIIVLGVLILKNTPELDPYRPLDSNIKPVKIQVVALQWKWLFIYPEENIATVNFIQFPEDTPVNFELTGDAPMNAFWIPSLSGQIYAMTGMSTKLHVMADRPGDFPGQAGEINGRGFSGMKFTARASSQEEYEKWIAQVKSSSNTLDSKEYDTLSKPSERNPVIFYHSVEENLYNKIIEKFMPVYEGDVHEHHHDD